MAIEFLGHKAALLGFIVSTIERSVGVTRGDIVDLFCGTASVSLAFKQRGWRVTANDHLVWCSDFAKAKLLNDGEPAFSGITHIIEGPVTHPFRSSPYQRVLDYLNELRPIRGFIHRSYSPASAEYEPTARMYFTEENAGRIDAIREQIRQWQAYLSEGEHSLLVMNLIEAANAVSNVAGTYGCYLKQWKERARLPLVLQPSMCHASALKHQVFCSDAAVLAPQLTSKVIYADPPYTKRQYAAYYHLLETIAVGDEPQITGTTGLRPWKEKASDYCYRAKAPKALEDLAMSLDCKHFFLSYNEDGQISHDNVVRILSVFGKVSVHEASYRRYKSSARPHKGRSLMERLYHLEFSR